MPQFDFSTLCAVTLSLTVSWVAYYGFFSMNLLPEVIMISKFRVKIFDQKSNKSLSKVCSPAVSLYGRLLKI